MSVGKQEVLLCGLGLRVVSLSPHLVPQIMPVQLACYEPAYHEKPESFVAKLQASPDTSVVCLALPPADTEWRTEPSAGSAVAGYLIALQASRFELPALNSTAPIGSTATATTTTSSKGEYSESSKAPDTLFLHDMAVHPSFQGMGVARWLLAEAMNKQQEKKLRRLALIAIEGAHDFWAKLGFEALEPSYLPESVRKKLRGYGDGACYMERKMSL